MERIICEVLSNMATSDRRKTLISCCASITWVEKMMTGFPFEDDESLLVLAEDSFRCLREPDWLEAFQGHPKLGDLESLRPEDENTKEIAKTEQSDIERDKDTLAELAKLNEQYFKKFGFIFIMFATGKSGSEILQALKKRSNNERSVEIAEAAKEQEAITILRLKKLGGMPSRDEKRFRFTSSTKPT